MRRRGQRSPAERAKHRERARIRSALVALILIGIAGYAAWIRHLPFQHPYEIRAVFSSSNQLRPGNPVRIAGIQVGTVEAIAPGPGNTTAVTMQIDDSGRPLHSDATLQIEPRLALEGNFYVDLHPGSPTAPILASGGTIPLRQTGIPVQLDQVLDVFGAPIRASLQSSFAQLATGLGPNQSPGSGAGGLRDANRELDAALGSITQVAQSAQGSRPGDLTRLIGASAAATEQLSRSPVALADLVTNTNRVTAAIAANDTALATSVRNLDGVLIAAPRALSSLDGALPILSRFAVALQPALRSAPAPLRSTAGLLGALSGLSSTPELPRLVSMLAPVLTDLPGLEGKLRGLFGWVTPVSECVSSHIVPVLDSKLNDGALSTGRPVWQDLVHSFVGVGAANPDFDANGKSIRITTALGDQQLDAVLPGVGQLVAADAPKLEGVDPMWLGRGVSPPWRPDQPCARQALPNLGLRREAGPPSGMQPTAMPAAKPIPATTLKALLAKALAAQNRSSRRR
jgi:phospholipid/cholesterol/gamma-HCH transport system substrate-binding protein